MTDLLRPVTKMKCSIPASFASSTAYWMRGRSTTVSISLGIAFVAGRNLVPRPATGNTAVRTRLTIVCSLAFDSHSIIGITVRLHCPSRHSHAWGAYRQREGCSRPAEVLPPAEAAGSLPRYAYMARFGDAGFGPNLASYFDRVGRLAGDNLVRRLIFSN